jgi:GT2 family glycosyltransferase
MTDRPRIVVLGMMTKIPVAGVIWQTLHYLVGFERLGYETYYVEAHARTPSMLMEHADDDSSGRAAAFIHGALERWGFGQRWAYQALHLDGRCYGMSEQQLRDLYDSAALIINLHGGTEPRPEHIATDRLVYLETDPVDVEVQLGEGRQSTIDYLRPHCAYFTYGENYGNPDCLLPVTPLFHFRPTRQPVVLDFWQGREESYGEHYTTIGNWKQQWREVEFKGEKYSWSKHLEFLKFLALPAHVGHRFELALAGCEHADRQLLESHGWRLREAEPLSQNIDIYRHYIASSRGEFTVAKEQNIRLRSGWFSDRAATYLAAGRPVITQDTGFGNILPTGKGLFAFSTLNDIVSAVEVIEGDYAKHSRAASDIAREYFDAERVLGRLLEETGMPRFPPGIVLAPVSRHPTTLPDATIKAVLAAPLAASVAPVAKPPEVSVVVVTFNGLVFNRLSVESVLGSVECPSLELIAVDNGSTDGSLEYLQGLAERDGRVRILANGRNLGFGAAVNRGLAEAGGNVFVVLNNDTIMPPRSLGRLVRHLDINHLGLVGPVSNDAATEAEIDASYTDYRELLRSADNLSGRHENPLLDVPVLTMFCIGLRRDVYERVGPLDGRFEVGLFEDDDYSLRVQQAGLRVACAEDVLVHHFGQGSLGERVPTGEYSVLFDTNRRRFEEKWGVAWQPHSRRRNDEYERLVHQIRQIVQEHVPAGARVLVVSKGDEEILQLGERQAEHFPQVAGGVYAGYYPGDSSEAIAALEQQRSRGAQFLLIPRTSVWWLDYYRDFATHLSTSYQRVVAADPACVLYDVRPHPP